MDLGLSGKHALVTGSTGGIGFAIARGLAAEGASVVVTGRTRATVDGALKRLRETVPAAKLTGLVADCATAAGADTVFAAVPELVPGATRGELAGFVWWHGWNDGVDPDRAVPAYEENLACLDYKDKLALKETKGTWANLVNLVCLV